MDYLRNTKGMVLVSAALVIVFGIVFSSCMTTVRQGYVGLKINTWGDDRGGIQLVGPGRYWLSFTEQMVEFPVFQQTYTFTKNPHEGANLDESIAFQSSEGTQVNMDMGVGYSLEMGRVPDMYRKFRKGVDELTSVVIRNTIRDAVGRIGAIYTVNDLIGARKSEFVQKVRDDVRQTMRPYGVNIEQLYIASEIRIPESIRESLDAKTRAIQDAERVENQLRQAIAQAKKDSVEAAGKAQANRLQQSSITPQLLQKMWIEKWDGKTPTVVGGGNSNLMFQIPSSGK